MMTQKTALGRGLKRRRSISIGAVLLGIIYHALMAFLVVVFAMPLVWMVSTSLKPESEVVRLPPKWIPNPFLWSNYPEMWHSSPFGAFYRNSIKIATFNVVGVLMLSSMAAYAFARIDFKGRNILFSLLLSTMMIPGVVTLIPLYITFKSIGWIDTHYPLWVPHTLSSVSSIFMLRQFFMTIPQDLEDAAKMDGCGNFGTYWKIVLPQVKPALATVGIFTFLGSWNSFIGPLIFLNTLEKQTLPMGLALFRTEFSTSVSLTMAAATIVTLPVLVVYFFAQGYFVQGITLSGIKG